MDKKITDALLRKLTGTPGETQKLTIGGGLALWVTLNRSGKTAKTWYLRYYDAVGKQQRSKLGNYPDISLAKAQALAEDAKKAGKEGVRLATANATKRRIIIEGNQNTQAQAQNTFEAVAEAWLEKKSITWVAGHTKRQRERLQGHLYHAFGNKPVNGITMIDVDAALSPLAKQSKSETAKRACDLIRNVLEYADTMGFLESGTILGRIAKYRREIPTSQAKRHLYKEMSEPEIGKLLLALEESKARWTVPTSVASRIAPYLFVRPSELCEAEWNEVNLETAEWYIPASRMKSRRDHVVPLSRQALALFEEIRNLTGGQQYVFPSWSKKGPISTNALIQVLRKLGYRSTRKETETFTTHGFRGMASTILYQTLQFPGDLIEMQLAHTEPNKVKAAYNQVGPRSYWDERKKMMQAYSDYLDGLRAKAAI